MNENEKKNNKSLFLYTALIFLVALLMIIISFFGQTHLEGVKETEERAETITQRASQLSDQNLYLTEQVTDLKENLEATQAQVEELDIAVKTLTAQIDSTNATIAAYNAVSAKQLQTAAAGIAAVNPELLNPEVKELYDYVIKKVTK